MVVMFTPRQAFLLQNGTWIVCGSTWVGGAQPKMLTMGAASSCFARFLGWMAMSSSAIWKDEQKYQPLSTYTYISSLTASAMNNNRRYSCC